jgi:hypothetical protein
MTMRFAPLQLPAAFLLPAALAAAPSLADGSAVCLGSR